MLQTTTTDKYKLEIISRENSSKGKSFKQHKVDGIDTIGVYENEPFKIKFQNLTCQKVQVKVSVDGTDILTGDLASTSPCDGQMWVVQAYGTLELKAWPEDHNGGAEFLFGHTADSVASNTHGDLSAKGLIAVAVFEEGSPDYYRPPPVVPYWPPPQEQWFGDNDIKIEWNRNSNIDYQTKDARKCRIGGGGTYSSSSMPETKCCVDSLSLEEGPAVGAGDHVEQHINKTAGVRLPLFAGVVQVKYEWWTSLRSKLRAETPPPHKAFPGDRGKLIDLGSTPRLESPNGRRSRIRKEAYKKRQHRVRRRRRDCRCQKYVEYDRFG